MACGVTRNGATLHARFNRWIRSSHTTADTGARAFSREVAS